MNYCEQCHQLCEGDTCPVCKKRNVRPPVASDFCFLAEKEAMWAEMLMDVLKSSDIACTCQSVLGAAISWKLGQTFERYKLYVPYECLNQAREILDTLFQE